MTDTQHQFCEDDCPLVAPASTEATHWDVGRFPKNPTLLAVTIGNSHILLTPDEADVFASRISQEARAIRPVPNPPASMANRVALAIAQHVTNLSRQAKGWPPVKVTWDDYPPSSREYYRREALVAIAAMQEP